MGKNVVELNNEIRIHGKIQRFFIPSIEDETHFLLRIRLLFSIQLQN